MFRINTLVAIALLIAIDASANAAPDRRGPTGAVELPPVEVSALRDPVAKSYRRIVSGMDLFERRRSLAPHAALRFKLLPRHRDTSMQDISLRIVGNTVTIPVAVADDHTFTLPRSRQALIEDAVVMPNRRARSMTWRTDVRTPGLPPNTRRLGDLRLECLVGVEAGLISNPRSLLEELSWMLRKDRYCEQRDPEYLFFADRPVWRVTLVDRTRREDLPVDRMYAGASREPLTRRDLKHCDCEVLLDRAYYAPLGDRSWSDETLLVIETMDEPARRLP